MQTFLPGIAFAAALLLVACGDRQVRSVDVVAACRVFGTVAKSIYPSAGPAIDLATAAIEAYTAPVCDVPQPAARDAGTGEWVLHNAAALEDVLTSPAN